MTQLSTFLHISRQRVVEAETEKYWQKCQLFDWQNDNLDEFPAAKNTLA
jgi:hypothetical protein